jgi:hypothetical protein
VGINTAGTSDLNNAAVASADAQPAGAEPAGKVSAARVIFRLAVGGTVLAVEEAGRSLRELADSRTDQRPTEPLPATSARHVLIGALALGPAWMNQLVRRGRGALFDSLFSHPAKLASRGLQVVARVMPTERLAHRADQLRTDALTTARRWADVGRREEQQGRSLARATGAFGLTQILDRVADSPQLRSVIREQSAGMGRSALVDLRERSARADGRAESVLGRLLPRRKPGNGHGSGTPR